MSTKYFALLTNTGAAKLAKATALGMQVEITQMAVGDGNGALPTPDPAQTALAHEIRRASLNVLTIDPLNTSQIIAEQVIPEDVGGWWIREIGLFDKDGDMVAIANCAETYKPQLQEGSGRVQVIRVILIVSSTEAVTLKIDPAVVLATRKYVDSEIIEVKNYIDDQLLTHEQSRNHPDATLTDKGFVQLSSSTGSLDETMAATPKAVRIAMDNANARLAKERNLADLTNIPLARQSLQLGNSATRNVGATAGTVAAGDDSRITGALQKDQNGADIPNKPLFLQNVGLTETVKQAAGAVPSTRKINNHALDKDLSLTPGDIGALPVTGGKLNGPLGIGTDNALGGNSLVLGDNDTGFKQDGDGVLGIYANNALVGYIDNSGLHMSVDVLTNGAVRAGNAKKLSLTSNNNSALTATFNLWGDANRPTVVELADDQGWHLYSQRNPDGSILFAVNGDIMANRKLNVGGATFYNDGNVNGSVWGGWLNSWINNNFVRAVRLGPQAISGVLWRDYQLGGGNVVTGFHTDGRWEMEGNDDHVYYRPVQYLVNGTWITASSV
ncbi:phage tail protein [Salmonella enterica]|nr:phage tail protein [Salmonella enterica]ECJ7687159.1 phage tail protein [Salmonella enterica]